MRHRQTHKFQSSCERHTVHSGVSRLGLAYQYHGKCSTSHAKQTRMQYCTMLAGTVHNAITPQIGSSQK